MVIAQLTLPTSQKGDSARCAFSVQGRSVDHGTNDWRENCIEVFVGGTRNGYGTHATDPAKRTALPPPAPPVVFGMTLHSPVRTECSDINALMDQTAGLQRRCCPGGQTECNLPTNCSDDTMDGVGCTVALSHLLDTCGDVLDELLPNATATGLHQLNGMCMDSLTLPDVIQELQQRVASGICTDADLEGVGMVQVLDDTECIDSHDSCDQLVQLLSCKDDLCPTCQMAGQCDLTCGICGGSGHRRAQNEEGATNTCTDIEEFQALAEEVTRACCDEATGGCAGTGAAPTECDARCAIVFVDFFGRCSNTLHAFSPADFHSYVRLNEACLHGMSMPDLLALLGGSCAV